MTDLAAALRASSVTYISIDTSGSVAKVGAWKPFGGYHTARHADAAVALTMALAAAEQKPSTDLSDLLG